MNDYLLFNTTCVQYCPDKYEPNDFGQCILVGLICPEGFTINEAGDGCIPNDFECKDGYIINNARTACVPAPGSVIPFPFVFFALCLGLLVFGSYLKDKAATKVKTLLIALIGSLEMLIYLLMLIYSATLLKWRVFLCTIVAILMLITSNIVMYLYVEKETKKDLAFTKWSKLYSKTAKFLPLSAMIFNFKLIKLFYSGFYGLDQC